MPERSLTVGVGVVAEMVRLAAQEVPGVLRVGRAGPLWRRLLLAPAVRAHLDDGRATIRLAIVARPGQALEPLAAEVRAAVTAAVERLLGLQLGAVTVVVDGVGEPSGPWLA